MEPDRVPTIEMIRTTAERISPYLIRTPVHHWQSEALNHLVGGDHGLWLKLEQWQRSGTFKARGVLSNILALDPAQRQRGVTAMSAGNHAVAVAWGAHRFGISAKVVMQATANPARVALARSLGADILLAPDGPTGFAMTEQIAREEGRTFIHPFDGELTALGTATLGLEFAEQVPALDAVLIAVGGGGLAGGAGRALRLLNPNCRLIGVEPAGADVMRRSFERGSAQKVDATRTIADSLAPPMTTPYSYSLCRATLDSLVTVTDDEIRRAMDLLFTELKLAVEPAAAAATAAFMHERAGSLRGQRVGIVICGSNIDVNSFTDLLNFTS